MTQIKLTILAFTSLVSIWPQYSAAQSVEDYPVEGQGLVTYMCGDYQEFEGTTDTISTKRNGLVWYSRITPSRPPLADTLSTSSILCELPENPTCADPRANRVVGTELGAAIPNMDLFRCIVKLCCDYASDAPLAELDADTPIIIR